MRMPGFLAEGSLNASGETYRTDGTGSGHTPGVLPQVADNDSCYQHCMNSDGRWDLCAFYCAFLK